MASTVGLAGLAGCGGNGDDGDGDDGGDGDDEIPENTVLMGTEGSEHYFDPIGLYVEPGTTITFENSGNHSSTAYHPDNDEDQRIPDDAESWDSGRLTEDGATFDHTFEVEGTYDYYCIPHQRLDMVGRIVVGDPGGPGEMGMPPDGDVPESGRIVDDEVVRYDDF